MALSSCPVETNTLSHSSLDNLIFNLDDYQIGLLLDVDGLKAELANVATKLWAPEIELETRTLQRANNSIWQCNVWRSFVYSMEGLLLS